MSPTVEGGNVNSRERINHFIYFSIDLMSDDLLNMEDFDTYAKRICFNPGFADMKFIVCGGQMFIFFTGWGHDEAYGNLYRAGVVSGKLECAGDINVDFGIPIKRVIKSYSGSLHGDKLLLQEDSDLYKFGFLTEKLGPFFAIR